MSLASKTRPISHALCDERSRQARWSLETGFAKSTGSSCNSPRLGIWLLTSGEPYPMRIRNFSFPLPTSQAIHGMIQHGLAVETPHLWSPVGCQKSILDVQSVPSRSSYHQSGRTIRCAYHLVLG